MMSFTYCFTRHLTETRLFLTRLPKTSCQRHYERSSIRKSTVLSAVNHILKPISLQNRSFMMNISHFRSLNSDTNFSFSSERKRNVIFDSYLQQKRHLQNDNHSFSGFSNSGEGSYDMICEETLDSLAECFEELASEHFHESDVDISLNSGVLTVNLGSKNGIYVINKQTPNQQIWLSSPFSGPKRYDYIAGRWIYRRDGTSLHVLLGRELAAIIGATVDFTRCSYGK